MNAIPLSTLLENLNRLPLMWGARYIVLFVLLLSAGVAQAAQIYIDGVACQLSDAIIAANTDQAVFGCAAGAGADTLILTRDIKLQLGDLPSITSDITIEFASQAAQECGSDGNEEPPDDPDDPPINDDPPDDPNDPPINDDPPDDPNDPPINDDPPDDPNDPPINDDPPGDDDPPVDPPTIPPIPPDEPDDPPGDPNDPPSEDTDIVPSPSPTQRIGDPGETPTIPPIITATSSPTPDGAATAFATVSGTPSGAITPTVPGDIGQPSANNAPEIPSHCLHIVSSGENLYRIALKYGLTVREMSNFNKLLSDDRLLEGQALIIPHEGCQQYAALKG